jgi:hypothetical protein
MLAGIVSTCVRSDWPSDGEALFARELVEQVEVDQVDWCHVLSKTNQRLRRRAFRRLVVAIANELERVEVLHADDLHPSGSKCCTPATSTG